MPDELIFGSYLNENREANISTDAVPSIICLFKTLNTTDSQYVFVNLNFRWKVLISINVKLDVSLKTTCSNDNQHLPLPIPVWGMRLDYWYSMQFHLNSPHAFTEAYVMVTEVTCWHISWQLLKTYDIFLSSAMSNHRT